MANRKGQEGCDGALVAYRKKMYDSMVDTFLAFEKNNHKRKCIYDFQDAYVHKKLKNG